MFFFLNFERVVKIEVMAEAKLYDLSFLNKISGGDVSFIKEMISTFKQVAPDYIKKSKEYYAKGLIDSLSKETHRFIPGVSFLNTKILEEDLLKIEEYTKKNINMDEVSQLLESVFGKVENLLNEFDADFQ
jgi:hypothetical protein